MNQGFSTFVENNLSKDILLITTGLPATGKTSAANYLAKRYDLQILRTDLIRKKIFSQKNIHNKKSAANLDLRKKVYQEMFKYAENQIDSNGVILDATFIKKELRMQAAEIANNKNKKFVILETICPKEIAIMRILNRTKENSDSNALTKDAYENNEKAYEDINIQKIKLKYPKLSGLYFVVDTKDYYPRTWKVVKSKEF